MHDGQMIEAVRYAGGFDTDDPDYNDVRIRRELNTTLVSTFSRVIVSSTEGYWKHCRTYPLVSGTQDYLMFHRASVGGLVDVEVSEADGQPFRPLQRASQKESANLESVTGSPTHFQEFHDYVRIYPTPDVSGWSLRMWFYLRPSALVERQTDGCITAIDTEALTLTVNTLPFDRETGVRTAEGDAGTGPYLIDVVTGYGIHALHLIEAEGDIVDEPIFTLSDPNPDGSALDMSRVKIGDYVRIAQQSEWPALPQEFHQTLADATASAILMRMGATDNARVLSEKVQSDLQRMQDLIDPRIKEAPRYLKHRYGPLAGNNVRAMRRWAR